MKKILSATPILLAMGAMVAPPASAAITAPYDGTDTNTVQLWSFDEAAGTSSINSDVTGGLELETADITGDGTSTTITSLTGGSAFSGFGNAIDLTGGGTQAGVLYEPNKLNTGDLGISEAFTLEAMVNMSSVTSGNQGIISMDSRDTRAFQFKITGDGDLRFHPITGGDGNVKETAVPTSGSDAFTADEWFHVAVTYTGDENASDNLSLYWTRVDSSRTEANLLGTFDMTADLNAGGGGDWFVIGNEGRDAGNEKLNGLIDEVRISDIARGADDMLFAVPEPSTFALFAGLAAFGLLIVRRRSQR